MDKNPFEGNQGKNRAYGESVEIGGYVDRGGTDYFMLPKKRGIPMDKNQKLKAQLKKLNNQQFGGK